MHICASHYVKLYIASTNHSCYTDVLADRRD